MHVLVTGGGGYLGAWLVPHLLAQGHRVRILDRFCYGREAVEAFADDARCEIVAGDIRRLQETPDLLDGIESVIHLAGLANDPSCALDLDMAQDVNVESTVELARRASDQGVRRFVFASACSVYGAGVFEWLDEESPANPVSSLGRCKQAAEEALLALRSSAFEPVAARMATLFGWSPRMRFDLAVNQMVATALQQGRIIVRGGGNQWRPFLHVQDAAQALAMLAEAPPEDVAGEVFNVGAEENNTRIADLATRVANHIAGVEVECQNDDDDLRSFRVRFGKLRDRVGFTCAHTLDDGIEEVRGELDRSPSLDPFASAHFNVARMKELLDTPVDEGGEPVAARFVPLAKPCIGIEEESAVIEALRSGWVTSGPQVAAFEKAFSTTVDAPYTVGVSSCTAALHLCLIDMGVGPGDEVITSPITWSSTGNTVLRMGAKVVFADVDPVTMNVTPETVEAAITDRTKAIMPVHLAGHPCDLDGIDALARRHGVPVVEDAAHALGAFYKGKPIGACGDRACFSFYAIKNITTMEGGMIALRDEAEAGRMRLLASNGMAATAWDRYGRSAAPSPQEVRTPGFKYALGNVSAAMGIEQLRKFDVFMAARRRLANLYLSVLSEIDEIALPAVMPEVDHSWHLFVIRLRLDRLNKTRDEIAYALRRENIGTGVHFYGLHLHEYYRETMGMTPDDYPVATRISHEILSLPLHPQLTDKNVHEVVAALKKVIVHARKT